MQAIIPHAFTHLMRMLVSNGSLDATCVEPNISLSLTGARVHRHHQPPKEGPRLNILMFRDGKGRETHQQHYA